MSLEEHHRIHEEVADPARHERIHRKRSVKVLDRWVLAMGILAPFSTLPQIVQVITTGTSAGISLTTWVLFMVFAVFWLAYGIVHEATPIIVTNALWLVMEVVLIATVLMYR